ncbi:CRISPR-associated endonuclease Cas2 [Methylomicrobium lacus]|uniref:CRISPR-associated endonuclease Cas2 n=1 Tax=Methylomicrobium lacus TaxID=136992 RepID=UPI0035A8E63B
MAKQRKKLYLISYDISDPKRLSRIHRVLKKAGLPLQYSVFTAVFSQTRLERLLTSIEHIIDTREDDVRCYVLPATVECKTLGRQMFPDDVLLFAGGINQLLG